MEGFAAAGGRKAGVGAGVGAGAGRGREGLHQLFSIELRRTQIQVRIYSAEEFVAVIIGRCHVASTARCWCVPSGTKSVLFVVSISAYRGRLFFFFWVHGFGFSSPLS